MTLGTRKGLNMCLATLAPDPNSPPGSWREAIIVSTYSFEHNGGGGPAKYWLHILEITRKSSEAALR